MDMSFLAPRDEVLDWRRVVLQGAAMEAGVFERLPGAVDEIADGAGLDPHAVRILLEALSVWEIVTANDGRYERGPQFPSDDEQMLTQQHAQFLRRWSTELGDRLADPVPEQSRRRSAMALESWLASLGARARGEAPALIDACLRESGDARTVLDVAGGHGEYGIEAARRGLAVTMLDLPAVVGIVRTWPRVRDSEVDLVAHDIFEGRVEGSFDLVLCFGFAHTQPRSRGAELFQRLADVTAPGGSVAVHTFSRGQEPVASLFAVQMLIAGNGGDTHALADYDDWFTGAGFNPPRIVDVGRRSLLVASKM